MTTRQHRATQSRDDDFDHGPEMFTAVFFVCCAMFLGCYVLVVAWRVL